MSQLSLWPSISALPIMCSQSQTQGHLEPFLYLQAWVPTILLTVIIISMTLPFYK